MEHAAILSLLNGSYAFHFSRLELIRDSGSEAYAAYADGGRYFLRMVKPAFFDTAVSALDIQTFLQQRDFPVPPITLTCRKTGGKAPGRCCSGFFRNTGNIIL